LQLFSLHGVRLDPTNSFPSSRRNKGADLFNSFSLSTVKRALLAGGFGRDIPSSDLPIEIATVVPPNPAHETLTPRRTHTQNVDGIAELPATQSEDSSDFDVEKADDFAIEQQANWQKAASIDGGTFGKLLSYSSSPRASR